ncbi:MAG: Do family serine endopeptidase [Pseudomonadota bacterium]
MRLILAAGLGLLLACSPAPQGSSPSRGLNDALAQNATAPSVAKEVPQSQGQITLSFAPVVKQAAPAVVNIYTKKVVRRRTPFDDDPFFRQFFGDFFPEQNRTRIENSLGSGVIVDPAGVVVSNHHVVGGADEITVVLNDRREFTAEVIFSDEESDLAVLQLDAAAGLPSLELRNSDTLEVGDLVLAIGNPFGVGQTVTSGIISALARPGGARNRGRGYFIQTDAPINPGNSGGALVDMTGRLVGVNTAIVSRSGGSNGIGFAVPANLVARVIESANEGQTMLERPWLGLRGQSVTGELAEALGILVPRGILVDQLHPDSQFARAGLASGDILTAIEGEDVNSPRELAFRVATLGTGRSARVSYLRDGSTDEVVVDLQSAPDQPARAELTVEAGRLAGLTVSTINPAVIEERALPLSARGLLVTQVRGPARRAGLKPGDILMAVDGTEVAQSRDLPALITKPRMVLELQRGGKRGTIRVDG